MQPFKLPDFYVPWPARLNPNLETARIHSKAWAREVGILNDLDGASNSPIWKEMDFERYDFALLSAYIHPDAPAEELNLMTDWNVWAFYVDDHFFQIYKRSNDRKGGKQYLDRVPLFMPIDLGPMPSPVNPMECALANLWMRTASTKSPAWRGRIIEDTRKLFDAFIWELDNISDQRLSNPIEYITMRRQAGAALWSADLVEHASFAEIPERIASTRPMRVLKETFADAVHLRNDIFSYQHEVEEGELANGVIVIERFLGIDPQRAVHLVNDLLTSRLQQFEHTVVTELAAIFDEYCLDPQEQFNVLNYIRGLQDWQSGAHAWHSQTCRYQNLNTGQKSRMYVSLPNLIGQGTISMRVTPGTLGLNRFKKYTHTPYQKVESPQLPEFYMPFIPKVNPHLELARKNSKIWARQMGMLDGLPDHPSVFIFDERRLDATDLALFCALAHPNVTATQLNLDACWIVWGVYADDYFTEVYGRTSDMAGAKIFQTRLSEFMPIETTVSTTTPLNSVEQGLADLWGRTTQPLSLSERYFFRQIIEDTIRSWVWELSNRIQNRIPDLIDYIEMRRQTSGSDFILILSRSVQGKDIPAEVHRTRIMQELNNTAIDYVYLTNDIFSYQKEIEFEGDNHNAVLVIQNFLNYEQMQAIEIVNRLMTARVKQFIYYVKTKLPVLFDDFNLDTLARKQLHAYVEELQYLMSGLLLWHKKTARYREAEFRRPIKPFTDIPTGLGMAAARIHTTFAKDVPVTTALPSHAEDISETTKPFAVSHLSPPWMKKEEEAQTD
jgi:germacradienol/geosmin synthase